MITIRYKPLKSGKFSTYLDIINENKRSYEFLKIHVTQDYSVVKKIAKDDVPLMQKVEELKSKRHLELINDNHGLTSSKKENVDFIEYANKYKLVNNDETCSRLIYHLKLYSKGKQIYINDLTYQWILSFKIYLNCVKQNSRRTYLWKLKQLLNHAVRIGIIRDHNFKDITIPTKTPTERTTLTIEEVRKLAETEGINPLIKQAFLFSCFTGLRLGDIVALKHSEIQGDEIVLIPTKTRNTQYKKLQVPLTAQAKEILSGIPKTSEKVFNGLPLRQGIGRAVTMWGLKAGLTKHLHFHAARHTFATIGITHGIDIYTMKELLGHSKIEMTQVYAKIVHDKKVQETKKFPTL